MEERIKFIVGQKKRYLNQIASKFADQKLHKKNLGVFLTIEKDGHIRTPREFIDAELPTLDVGHAKLSKKEKAVYDKIYYASLTYLVDCFNEANKKYNAIFDSLDVYDKMELLKEEVNTLLVEQKRANAYFAALDRQSREKTLSKFENGDRLTEQQLMESNQEITQIKYIDAQLTLKQTLLEELRNSL